MIDLDLVVADNKPIPTRVKLSAPVCWLIILASTLLVLTGSVSYKSIAVDYSSMNPEIVRMLEVNQMTHVKRYCKREGISIFQYAQRLCAY